MQLEDDTFSAAAPIPGLTGFVFTTNFDAASGTFAAAGSGGPAHGPSYIERTRSGDRSVAEVVLDDAGGALPGYVSVKANGWMPDGSAFVIIRSAAGLTSYRRIGATWSKDRVLVAATEAGLGMVFVVAPPFGGESVVGTYFDNGSSALKAFRWNLATGEVSESATLVSFYEQPIVAPALSPDGTSARFLIFDYESRRAWLAAMDNGEFSAAAPLRSDLVFDSVPRLLYHPKGGFMILHQTRLPAQGENSGSTLFERLEAFVSAGS